MKDNFSIRDDIKEIYLRNKDLYWGKFVITDIYGNFASQNYGERKYYVYEWYTKDDNKIFYVGKGTGTRYNHIVTSDMKRGRGQYYKELQEKKGINYRIVIDNLTDIESQIYEIYWINKRHNEGEVLLQTIDVPSNMTEKEEEEYEKTFENRTFEPKIEISDYRKRYFGVVKEPKYDNVEEIDLLKTYYLPENWLTRLGKNLEYEKKKIRSYVEFKKGKVYSTLTPNVNCVIEFGILDYDKYMFLKEKGYKVYHAFHVIKYIDKDPTFMFRKKDIITMPNNIDLNTEYDLSSIFQDLNNSDEMEKIIKTLSSNLPYGYLKLEDCHSDEDKSFCYYGLCKEVYKKRKESDKYIEITKQICIRDLKIIESNILKFSDYMIPTLVRLINIYINQKEYDKALELCKFALHYKIKDDTKDGYKGRYNKIISLQEKQGK